MRLLLRRCKEICCAQFIGIGLARPSKSPVADITDFGRGAHPTVRPRRRECNGCSRSAGKSSISGKAQGGDIITQLDGKPVTSGVSFDAEIAQYKPGSQMRVSYMRGAWQSETTITVEQE
jgi:S1-C subfamily serine protease